MCRWLFMLGVLAPTLVSEIALGQTSSRGPGKGPPSPGSGSKYTYPQPAKAKPAEVSFVPESQIPEYPERYRWVLAAKNLNPDSPSKSVPIYQFNPISGKRTNVGEAQEGEEVTLDEVRVCARRNHFKYNGKMSQNPNAKLGVAPEFWVDGMNVKFAGKR